MRFDAIGRDIPADDVTWLRSESQRTTGYRLSPCGKHHSRNLIPLFMGNERRGHVYFQDGGVRISVFKAGGAITRKAERIDLRKG